MQDLDKKVGLKPKKLWLESRLKDVYEALVRQLGGAAPPDMKLVNKWHREATRILKEMETVGQE